MSKTSIPFGSPLAPKVWSAGLAAEVNQKSYFTRKFIGKGENNIIEEKMDLVSASGDTVQFDLSVQLREEPTEGDTSIDGKEEGLAFYSDEVVINQIRKPISLGGRMSRKRTVHNTRTVAKQRGSEYWAKWKDELTFMYLSGARGINEDFIQATDYAGFANNAFQAPDASHLVYGGSATSKATLVAADKMNRDLIEKVVTHACMMRSEDRESANMVPMTIKGEDHFVMVMSKWQEHDMRTESGTSGWLELQKAAAASEGNKNKIFTGSLGMINNCVLHSHTSVIRFSDYGASSDVAASRALFMGRQAAVIAYGQTRNNRYSWTEELKDYKNLPSIASGFIFGMKKTRFNDRDFGVVAVDTAAAKPA